MPGATEVDDVRLFTDSVARARFGLDDRLDKLEHDIRYEILRGGAMGELDHECKCELDQLEHEGLLRKLPSFGALSPSRPSTAPGRTAS